MMRPKEKQNDILSVNNRWQDKYHTRFQSESALMTINNQISPVKRNKIGDSLITNIFDDYAKSTTQINYPASLANKYQGSDIQTYKQIRVPSSQQIDPEGEKEWKNKYQQLYRNYDVLTRKLDNRNKQALKMQQTINSQANIIRELQQNNNQLSMKYTSLMAQTQRNQRWNSNSMSQMPDNNMGCQVNRFYVEQLQRTMENLQRENRRLSETIMRKVKHSFQY